MSRYESEEMSTDDGGRIRWGKRGAGLLIFSEGQVLLTLRSGEVMDPYVWGIPGGRIEPGEEPIEAAIAEAQEELGLKLPSVPVVGPHVYKSGGFEYYTYAMPLSATQAKRLKPSLNWENDSWGWFRVDQLPVPMHPNVVRALKHLAQTEKGMGSILTWMLLLPFIPP